MSPQGETINNWKRETETISEIENPVTQLEQPRGYVEEARRLGGGRAFLEGGGVVGWIR